ncbi:arabinogalactan oligomer / maltooligosaccharide transport system substrate-binding protein [Lachnospiraceae bacterium NK3A20]|nr:arabinogalactan oligomer / maltooligosaccharide transport system substrate-binding protein [Lachnospiraceae bacterium NK3A20]
MKKKFVAIMMAAATAGTLLAGCGSAPATDAAKADTAAETAATEAVAAATDAAEAVTEAAEGATEAPAADAGEVPGLVEGDYSTPQEVKVWVADNAVDFTNEQIAEFQKANPDLADWTFTVEPVGEGDAATNVITDVEAGADVYTFAQDQIARLVSAGALEEVAPDNVAWVKAANDEGSVGAATVGDTLYAYPVTSDNGYFMYYDKSVVTDPSDLDTIIKDCEAAGKNIYMEINSGWYNTAFFFATGCTLTYDTDDQGNFTAANVDYATDAGVAALKEMTKLANSSSFQNGSSAGNATNYAVIIDGTWDAESIKQVLGDNYACAKLPSFTTEDGQTYQMSGFGGFKLVGVKPQEDDAKLSVCDALAAYLTSGDVQLARYNAIGWGPSNTTAQASDEVKSDVALTALADQLQYTIPQGQYPSEYWDRAKALGDDIISKTITADASDEDLMAELQTFQDDCISYAQ